MRFFDTHTHTLPPRTSDHTAIFNLRIKRCDDFSNYLNEVSSNNYFSVGIHPYDIELADNEWIGVLEKLAIHPRCIAIGEAGIDHRIGNLERQKEIFALHCTLANGLQKPLIIHCVKSQGDVLRLSRDAGVPRIFHSYSRVNQEISKTTNIIYSLSMRNLSMPSSVLQIPMSQILLETDEQTPSIEEVYAQFAKVQKMSIDEVGRCVEQNFFRTFAL